MDEERGTSIMDGPPENENYLHSSGVALYVEKRPRRDNPWTVAYCLAAALIFVCGIPAFVHTDPNAGLYTQSFFYNSTTCDVQAYTAANPPVGDVSVDMDPTFLNAFKKQASIWMPITAVLSVVTSAVYLLLFRRFAKAMVMLTIGFSLGFSLLFAIVCFAVGAFPMGIILIICTAISAVFYWWIRAQLRMCAELLAIAGRGLNENLGLVPAAIGIKIAGLCVLTYSMAAFFSATNIGHARPNHSVVTMITDTSRPESAVCLDASSMDPNAHRIPCCEFVTTGWAHVFAIAASSFVAWTSMLIMEIKLYTVADTIAQWYFSASAAGSSAAVASRMAPGSVRRSLRNALTSSFGTIAFAAAILALIRAMRRSLQEQGRKNIICCIINCIAQPLLALLEKFTRFATIAAAITGQALVPSAKSVFETLKRNFLQTYSMWWVPESVLNFAVALLSLSWAGVVFFSTFAATSKYDTGLSLGVSFAIAFAAFFLMLFSLLFVSGLLLDAVNTLYICYAMDKDNRRVTHPEIHAIYSQVPGLAVENPDGGVMYGAPDPAQPAPPPAPPAYPGMYAPAQPTYPAVGYPAYAPAPVVQPPPPPGGYTYVANDRV
ncbi:hypothetical protein GPECTOR_11g140 [Gonium pectorale]|uniref:Choline transporter-like protein n=1 Tax=Gonium pectorale TaxID=33097 RepID=A0A150GQR4_GONPE|nr:hypothetical protein GPECTOR_11g140 [Gonium pectorale]|eukprot:KXZ51690.1 hypothetical protein GPECTOR_11g140 [Gonium pectorale]